jgi:hypothetical protein
MSRRVHLWPTGDAWIEGVPPVEFSVAPEVADRLTAYQPPAFQRSKPDGWDERPASEEDEARLARFLDAPPDEVADQQPEGPADAGPSVSEA